MACVCVCAQPENEITQKATVGTIKTHSAPIIAWSKQILFFGPSSMLEFNHKLDNQFWKMLLMINKY